MLRIEGEATSGSPIPTASSGDRHPALRPQALVPEAERTARAAEERTRWTMELLAEHEITKRRRVRGSAGLQRRDAEGGGSAARADVSRT